MAGTTEELVRWERDRRDTGVLLRLAGRLSLRTVPTLRTLLVKTLLDDGRVVAELSGLRLETRAGVMLFPAALAAVGGWPAARLAVCGADDVMAGALAASRVGRSVPVVPTVPRAFAALDQRPSCLRTQRGLGADVLAPRLGRALVRDTCRVWGVAEEQTEDVELVVSELVSNAVEHGRSASRLSVELCRCRSGPITLSIRVRDWSAAPVAPRPLDVGSPRGRGLLLTEALADGWGVRPHPDGKTVWVHWRGVRLAAAEGVRDQPSASC